VNYKKISIIGSLGIHLLFGFFILNLGTKNEKRESLFFVNLVKIDENYEINNFKRFEGKSEIRKIDKKRDSVKNNVKEEDKIEKNFENNDGRELYKVDDFKSNERINSEEKQNLEIGKVKEEDLGLHLEISKNGKESDGVSGAKISEKGTIYISGRDNTLYSGTNSPGATSKNESHGKINEVDLNKSNEDFFYYKIVKEKIIKKIVYPEIARRRNIEGNVKIGFIVLRNGEVEEIKVIKSSKYEILDKNSINIIKSALPFPKFPDTLNYEKILFVMDFNYKLKSVVSNKKFG